MASKLLSGKVLTSLHIIERVDSEAEVQVQRVSFIFQLHSEVPYNNTLDMAETTLGKIIAKQSSLGKEAT